MIITVVLTDESGLERIGGLRIIMNNNEIDEYFSKASSRHQRHRDRTTHRTHFLADVHRSVWGGVFCGRKRWGVDVVQFNYSR